jgi:hypothetical protein
MSDSTSKDMSEQTRALQEIADDVERERRERGHTVFDDQGVGDGEPPAQAEPRAEDLPVEQEVAQAARSVPPADLTPTHDRMK